MANTSKQTQSQSYTQSFITPPCLQLFLHRHSKFNLGPINIHHIRDIIRHLAHLQRLALGINRNRAWRFPNTLLASSYRKQISLLVLDHLLQQSLGTASFSRLALRYLIRRQRRQVVGNGVGFSLGRRTEDDSFEGIFPCAFY